MGESRHSPRQNVMVVHLTDTRTLSGPLSKVRAHEVKARLTLSLKPMFKDKARLTFESKAKTREYKGRLTLSRWLDFMKLKHG